jgi:hypothetical protein
MHSVTFILLRPPFSDLTDRIMAVIEPHRMDDESYDPSRHFDYWTAGDGDNINDPETEAAIGLAPDDMHHDNVCFVSRLEGRRTPGAIVTPEGDWHDLYDHGWKFRERETPQGIAAYERWSAHAAELFAANQDCLVVEIDTHS